MLENLIAQDSGKKDFHLATFLIDGSRTQLYLGKSKEIANSGRH
jgi:hypothetical protein